MEQLAGIHGIFDSHAHYDDARFDPDREELLPRLNRDGVVGILNAGCDLESSRRSIAIARQYPFVWAAVGIQPEYAGGVPLDTDWLAPFEEMLKEDRVKAIGEIGLDYHYEDGPDRAVQQLIFREQLKLAERTGYPVVIHSRDATEDTLSILRELRPKGVLHCFSGSVETAREALDLGLYLGFTGVVTFPSAKRAKAVASMIPLDRLLLETDCPYMAPVPFRGTRSTSDQIACTAAAIAELRGLSPQEVVDIACANVRRLYSIPE